ncbi:hypothetical protein cu0612 [Corynebacterium urealyticum DSM 7109]|uniref:Uncharacterized protein n=1 Tax=Corynebacterium urealyticum (strain ATCC 43042 / DSM 7109) TaxID=504474 RepID=B1VFN3_CORU7|nr:hypothetical protein cu0612 [Corynebacterium urealyticum DSM 7109]
MQKCVRWPILRPYIAHKKTGRATVIRSPAGDAARELL